MFVLIRAKEERASEGIDQLGRHVADSASNTHGQLKGTVAAKSYTSYTVELRSDNNKMIPESHKIFCPLRKDGGPIRPSAIKN
jgi:hypothetical protein